MFGMDLSRPLASAGVAGATTLSPGKWAKITSGVWEWVAANCLPPPEVVRTTRGTLNCPPKHGMDLGRLVDDLVEGEIGEVDRHDLGDWTQAVHGCPDGRADYGPL